MKQPGKILKFGGSTLKNRERIQSALDLMEQEARASRQVVLVISAFGDVTDQLILMSRKAAASDTEYKRLFEEIEKRHLEIIKSLIPDDAQKEVLDRVRILLGALQDTVHGTFLVKELSPKTLDFIMGHGELLATEIIGGCLRVRNLLTEIIDPASIILTNHQYGEAKVDLDKTLQRIKETLTDKVSILLVPGFIGGTEQNERTTLGRGGSDYTATLIGAGLDAERVEIWTEVDGIMTADPNKVGKAFPINALTWEEAMELSHFGAKLLFPQAMVPAAMNNLSIHIRGIETPDHAGTTIGSQVKSDLPVKGISSIDQVALLRVQGSGMIGVIGVAHRLFEALARFNINVILISQASSEHSICLAVDPNHADKAKTAIQSEFELEISANRMDDITIEKNVSIIAVVGENMRRTTGVAGRMFQALGKNGINIIAIAQGSSELNISVVVEKKDEAKSLNALHEGFFLSDTKTLHVFVVGTGLIGGTLLKQMGEQAARLNENASIDIRLMGIGDIHQMVLNEDGMHPASWRDALKDGMDMNLDEFVDTMLDMNLPNSVFVDCTGSHDIVDHYERILNASISIVTPNKIANSGPYSRYQTLRESAARHGARFLYETNVGAGLPVISTLNDLMCSGDRIVKIEAILSGTLSFIFNSYTEDKKFSNIVKEAKARGFSEPDPRDDLNGLDVVRKILILARESGLKLEPEDVWVENILPPACRDAETVEAFFGELEKADTTFAALRNEAAESGHRLRYMATLENHQATVSLKAVDAAHPFYSMSGSDNMIVFTTERYKELPLVIRGPGAGAEVTAAGVFSDIIRIANYLS